MAGTLVIYLIFQGVLLYDTLAWQVIMPREIHGLQGSCLVIPCSFYYTSYPPTNPHRVVWYQWVSRGYPLIYDPWYPTYVIDKFRGHTSLYGSPSNRDCSLLIDPLRLSHDAEKVYTWIDPENVGKSTYAFFDVTSTIRVDTEAERPKIYIYGGDRTGDAIKVSCIIHHTCPYSKPNIILKGIEGSDHVGHEHFKDGLWKITLTRTGVMKTEDSNIECSVTHHGGITATATVSKSAKCVHYNTTIEPELADVIEGVAKNFTCTVYHSCQKENPTITWNYQNMQVSHGNRKLATFSNLTFFGTNEDNGKKLTCTAKFSGGDFTAYVILRVQEYVKPVDPVQNETLFNYVADVVPKITALPRSCVVVPCSFKIEKEYVTRLRGLWVDEAGDYMFHTGQSNILDNFKGRTKLLGNPDEQNCTVEIDNVQNHDNGPFCFRAEKDKEKYNFNNSCVFILMRAAPDKPVMSNLPETIEPGTRVTVTCSVKHTCPSHPPDITWSLPTARASISHQQMGGGVWETVSTVIFIPTGYETDEDIVCRAKFWRGRTEENSALLNIRRIPGIGLETIGPYVIAFSLVFLFICIIAGVIIFKRRRSCRQPPDEMQGRPEQRRSQWNRFSRFSERRPFNPYRANWNEMRQSMWSRFSRRHSPRTNADMRVEYNSNNIRTVSGSKPFSKPRVPSPKSEPKSFCGYDHDADYTNNVKDNIYGNV